ncbi:Fic family protein [Listeria monocytogenes]
MKDNLLKSALEGIKLEAFGEVLYPDIIAHLWFLLAKNHCFVNGNKRTTLIVAVFS